MRWRRTSPVDPELNQVVFDQDEQILLLALVRKRLNPDDFDDPKIKALIYKVKGLNAQDQIWWAGP